MSGRLSTYLGRALIALMVLAHLGASASMAATHAGGDVSGFVCGSPNGEPSAAALRLAHEIADRLGQGDGDETAPSGDCPLCVLAHGAPLPVFELPREQVAFADRPEPLRTFEGVIASPRGPPVGSQGPPLLS